ncbi:hypothetical protein D3C73_1373420 [compost metagenome]
MLGIVRLGQRRTQQAFAGAVALQGIENERFFIWGWRFQRFEIHLQPLTEEMPHRVAQKVIQLGEAQGFIVLVRRQVGVALLILLTLPVQHLPFMGKAEQRAALLEVTRAERL